MTKGEYAMGNTLKKPVFVVSVLSCLLALAGLAYYYTNGKTQYNENKLAQIIIIMVIAAVVLAVLAMIIKHRLFLYGAALAMLYAFLEFVVTEINFWSNWIIATDPVSPEVLQQYFCITILFLVAMVLAFIAAGMAKGSFYRAAKEAK
ncbi:MAG: hypothetical protein IKQ96_08765 [Lachnospiraceae bacterium]|nr:hypothetical protein [Lachnospiraceae bacterium]